MHKHASDSTSYKPHRPMSSVLNSMYCDLLEVSDSVYVLYIKTLDKWPMIYFNLCCCHTVGMASISTIHLLKCLYHDCASHQYVNFSLLFLTSEENWGIIRAHPPIRATPSRPQTAHSSSDAYCTLTSRTFSSTSFNLISSAVCNFQEWRWTFQTFYQETNNVYTVCDRLVGLWN